MSLPSRPRPPPPHLTSQHLPPEGLARMVEVKVETIKMKSLNTSGLKQYDNYTINLGHLSMLVGFHSLLYVVVCLFSCTI